MIYHVYAYKDPAIQAFTAPIVIDKEPKDFKELIRRSVVKNPNSPETNYETFHLGTYDDSVGQLFAGDPALVCRNYDFVKPKEDMPHGNGN